MRFRFSVQPRFFVPGKRMGAEYMKEVFKAMASENPRESGACHQKGASILMDVLKKGTLDDILMIQGGFTLR